MTIKTILVVGGAGGVGSALVELLAGRGDKVITTVLNPQEAATIKNRYGETVQCHAVDLSDAGAALLELKKIVSNLDHLDAAVVCAAIAPVGPMELTPLATFAKAYEINCIGLVAVYQAAMPALRQTSGRIVLLSSMAGRAAFPFMSAYSATKFAIEGLGDVMRREAGPQGVKISIIQPGGIRTNLVRQQLVDMEPAYAALGQAERELYEPLFLGYQKVAGDGLRETASTPEQIAAVIAEALDAQDPQSRYVAGADAKQFFEISRTMPDRDIDALFHQMFQA